MSKNYDRMVTKNVTDNGTYKKLQLRITYPPYDDSWCFTNENNLFNYQYRMYRTWKYTRKNQYK